MTDLFWIWSNYTWETLLITDPPKTRSTNLSTTKTKKNWHVTPDMWHLTRDTLHVTHDTWQVTYGEGLPFSQNFRFTAVTVWDRQCLEDEGWLNEWINEWINDEGVSRTASAMTGLLLSCSYSTNVFYNFNGQAQTCNLSAAKKKKYIYQKYNIILKKILN